MARGVTCKENPSSGGASFTPVGDRHGWLVSSMSKV